MTAGAPGTGAEAGIAPVRECAARVLEALEGLGGALAV
ncbi:hypothetical protein GA0115259_101871, partial [Streptomyces sp. MnatMP-M17]